ncbi:hypothetical protein Pflav_067510 [Phytohabitans flavus]|uniref:2-amino-4-hydroxy-6-hydroxymethyldihydropteridine diphosphokinase n=1 Tax=Phytohabitans flavus TaxID=1076124 RepID=A0A6F8Y2Z1_9ACTN|nr:hypothetical protein Pflav_067510 [Phytohabitans flavus]
MTRALLSLGSNLGDRIGHLKAAVRDLDGVLLVASGVYETPPWGDDDQPPYLNAALLVQDAAATPRDWLDRARALEEKAGRVRDPDRQFGPRTLDVDVIAVWSDEGEPVTSDDPELTLPHPVRTCGRSSCGPGSTSSRTPSCPAMAGSPTCSTPSRSRRTPWQSALGPTSG